MINAIGKHGLRALSELLAHLDSKPLSFAGVATLPEVEGYEQVQVVIRQVGESHCVVFADPELP